ncbi:hypothetical protein MXD61_08470 [Frankia sp. AgPm24]|uniref:hypothetical protein n=1 Tax=Frankia sp. AgPm24 TaxID=631128 RepID=UPI00200CBC71|nr:hypothetical protein [Frankia sp. AgPm24]MCK9921917.1 hypothetical protein [Frankia sp. AgPm24]
MNGYPARGESTALDLAGAAFTEVAARGLCVLEGREVHEELPQRPVGIVELQGLLGASGLSVRARAAVWRTLARRQGEDGWLVAAVGMALPMLRHISAALADGHPDLRADLDSEVLTGFLEALRASGSGVGVEHRLVWGAYRAGVAFAFLQVPRLPAGTCVPVAAAWPAPPWSAGLRRLLTRAVSIGVLSEPQARLMLSARRGVTPAVLSAATVTPGEEWALRLAVAHDQLLHAVLADELGPRRPGPGR